jgi:hypothetical protein
MSKLSKTLRTGVAALAFVGAGLVPALAVQFVDNLQYYPAQAGVSAPAGQVGELVTSTVLLGSAVTYTVTATPYNLTSVSLSPGQWQCSGNVINTAAGTTFVSSIAAFSSTSATLPTAPAGGYSQTAMGGSTNVGGLVTGVANIQVPAGAPVTYYLVMQAAFTGVAPTAYGSVNCLRVR